MSFLLIQKNVISQRLFSVKSDLNNFATVSTCEDISNKVELKKKNLNWNNTAGNTTTVSLLGIFIDVSFNEN